MSQDAERKTVAPEREAPRSESPPRFPPPQLRLHDRQVYVGFGATPLGEGLVLADLALIVPEVTFPFDIAGSAATRYQKKKCRFGYLDLQLDHALLHRAVRRVHEACDEHVAALRLHLRPNLMEGEGLLHSPGKPAPFTFRIGFQPEGSAVVACAYDVRLYGPAPVPASFLAALLGRAAARYGSVPDSKPWGAVGISFDPVPALLRKAVPLRGFRLPEMGDARLARVEPGPSAFHLHFAANARADLSLDEGLLTCIEGSRSFAQGEKLLAQGDLAAAEAFYLRHGEAPDSHPFAQERLLTLLAARPDAQDLALDVAQGLRRARPGAAASYWAEATLRLARGERRRAGELFLELAQIARARGEEAAAFHAFAAAGRALAEASPPKASRAFQDALVFRPDDLDSLLALATAADRAADHEGAMRACRRIAALARDPQQAARAHVRLGQLLLKLSDDRAAARLHFDAALRLVPDDPEALVQLAGLCRLDGEHLRALRLLDQLRAAATASENRELEARACLQAGAVWEEGLGHLANALLRYQEAVDLAPGDCEAHLRLAALLERLDRHAEALEAYRQVAVLAEGRTGGPEGEGYRFSAHKANRALARITLERLGDRAGAIRYFEAALALAPDDVESMRALLDHFRAQGRISDLARACERCAAATASSRERAELLAEAGALFAGPLDQPDKAQRLLEQALLLQPDSRPTIETLAALAEKRGDGAAVCRHLLRLAELSQEPGEKAAVLRQLARAARDLAGDLHLAADALARALALEPEDLSSLGELCALQRRRGDEPALAAALASYARALEREGEFAQAAAALRELAMLGARRLGRSEQALEQLEHALVLAPDDPETLLDLGDLSLDLGRPAAAREAFESLLGALPRDAAAERVIDLKIRLAKACDALGEREAAIEAYATAMSARPGDDAIGDRLDALLAEAERPRERAAALLSRGKAKREARLAGAAAGHFSAAGEQLRALGELRAARAAFEASLDADPDGPAAPAALDALAEMALAERDDPRACELLARRAAFEGDPRATARLLFRAATLARRELPSRHHALLAAAVGRDGLFPPARAALAELRLAEGELAQALSHAEAALAGGADPDALEPRARAQLQRLAARAAAGLEDYETARRHLSAYCDAEPADREALADLAALLRRTGETEELVQVLARLADKLEGRERGLALRELAPLLIALPGRREQALDAWRRALEALPDDREVLEGLVGALDGPGDALERASLLARLAELTREPERKHRLLFERGEALMLAEHFPEAAEAFAEAARCGSRPAGALERLATAAALAGDDAAEIDALSRRAQLAAREGEADAAERYLALGLRLVELGESDRAVPALARAVDLARAPLVERDALVPLVDLLEAGGAREEAVHRLERLATLLKGNERAAALVRRAEHLKALDDLEAARDALGLALETSPGDRRAILLLKAVCGELGDDAGYARALEALLALPHRNRQEAAGLAAELGETLLRKLGEPERAEAALRKALALDRNRFDAARSLFEILVERGDLEEALPLGESLARRVEDPRKAAAWLTALHKLALSGLGDNGLALRYARLAYERDGSDPATALRLADSLYAMGAVAEALPLYRRLAASVDFDSDREGAEAVLLRLAELSLWSGDRARAIGVLRQLLEVRPTCAPAAELLYEALLPHDPAGAINALSRHARALAPGERALKIFMALAEQARARLGSASLAAELLELARPSALDPLPVDLARAEALRAAGDKPALAAALRSIAERSLEIDATAAARQALDELADVLSDLRDFAGAARVLAECADLCVELADTAAAAERLRRRGLLLRERLDDPGAAEKAFRRAFQLDPGDLQSALQAAELCGLRGDRSGEAELLEALLPLLPEEDGRAAALLRLARLQLALGDSARAGGALEEALRLQPDFDEARDLFDELLGLECRFAELAASYEARAATMSERQPRVALLRRAADIYRDQAEDLAEAARVLDEARALAPDDLELAEACAEALVAAGRDEDAAALDATLLARDPRNEKAFARRIAHLRSLDDAEGLALLYEYRAAHEPPQAAAALLLDAAELRQALGHLTAAEDDARRAFDLDPANERAFSVLVGKCAGRNPETLAELLEKRARAVPAEAAGLHRTRAQVLVEVGKLEAAASALDAALALSADDLESLALRADLAKELEGDVAALPFDERLLALAESGARLPQPHLVRAQYRSGLAVFAQGDLSLAADRLGAAFGLDAHHGRTDEALEALARCHAASGDRARLYAVSMARAERLEDPAKRAAALRQAAEAAPDAARELAALEPLASIERADLELQELLAEKLHAARRYEDQVSVLAQAADRAEPGRQAALLLRAAAVARKELGDRARARSLRARALAADPKNLEALRATIEDLRELAEPERLAAALADLTSRTPDAAEAGQARLERARCLDAAGSAEAADAWASLVAIGREAPGFEEACERARALFEGAGRFREAAEVLVARAGAEPAAAAASLLDAARLLDEEAGEPERALELLTRAVQAAPESPLPFAARAAIFERLGRAAEQAEALLEEARRIESTPERAPRLLRAGSLLAGLERWDEALAALRGAVEADGGLCDARLALADVCERRGQSEEALEQVLVVLELSGEGSERQKELELRGARLARHLGRAQDALRLFESAFAREPGNDEAFAAVRELAAGDAAKLVALLERREAHLVERGEPARAELVELLCDKAELLARDPQRAQEAERVLRAAAGLDPRHRRALAALRELAESREDYPVLLEVLGLESEAAEDEAERFSTLVRLAEIAAEKLGDHRRAADALEKALAVASEAARHATERSLAFALLRCGEPARSLEIARRLAGEGGDDARALHELAADALEALGDPAAAGEELLAALALAPDDEALFARIEAIGLAESEALLARALELRASRREGSARGELLRRCAEAWRRAGDPAAETKTLRQALDCDPDSQPAFDRLRELLRTAGEIADLVDLIERGAARRADAEAAGLWLEAGELARDLLGEPDRAQLAFQRALERDPESPRAADSLAELLFASGHLGTETCGELESSAGPAALRAVAIRLAESCEAAGKKAEALAHFEVAARGKPALPKALEGMLRCAERARDAHKGLAATLGLLPLARGAEAGRLHLRAADFLVALGRNDEAMPHLQAAAVHGAGGPEALQRLSDWYLEREHWPEGAATLTWYAEAAGAPDERLAARKVAARLYADRVGDVGHATSVIERALEEAPQDRELLDALCDVAIRAESGAVLVRAAERLEEIAGAAAIEPYLLPLGRALVAQSREAEGLRRLCAALDLAFGEEIAREAQRLADALGDLDAYAGIELRLIDRIAEERPDEAAARLRALAGRLEQQQPARAAELLERAYGLAPDHRDLERQAELFERDPSTVARAVRPLAELARSAPLAADRRDKLASAAEAAGQDERARLLRSVDAFFERRPTEARIPARPIDGSLRERLYAPLAQGPVARLLAAVAREAGAAFGSTLARLGLDEARRIGPDYAPALHARLRAARSAVGIARLDAWIDPEGGELRLEPGETDRLILGLALLARADGGALAFLLLRACELSRAGYAVARLAGSEGLADLVESIAAALDLEAQVQAPFSARVEALASRLSGRDEDALRALALEARAELRHVDAEALLTAIERSASRVALVACGDAGAAMRASLLLAPSYREADPEVIDPDGAALALPELQDEVLTCLRDDLGELCEAVRRSAE
ncbi:MAG: tetratricopeptide repeat protein [Myxococcales bacterium]|jgi:tetratricopeptide (TPR) repeat protein